VFELAQVLGSADDPPIELIIIIGLLIIGIPFLIIYLIVVKGKLRRARKALAEGNAAEALGLFQWVARMEFDSTVAGARLAEALEGIEKAYASARQGGIPRHELGRIRELRADLVALFGDKKYHSVFASSFDGNLTKDGVKIREKIKAEAKAILDGLPKLEAGPALRGQGQ